MYINVLVLFQTMEKQKPLILQGLKDIVGWLKGGDGGSRKPLILKAINAVIIKTIPKSIPKTTNSHHLRLLTQILHQSDKKGGIRYRNHSYYWYLNPIYNVQYHYSPLGPNILIPQHTQQTLFPYDSASSVAPVKGKKVGIDFL